MSEMDIDKFLMELHNEALDGMLRDLKDPDKRSPQLLKTVLDYMKAHKFIDSPAFDRKSETQTKMGDLMASLQDYAEEDKTFSFKDAVG